MEPALASEKRSVAAAVLVTNTRTAAANDLVSDARVGFAALVPALAIVAAVVVATRVRDDCRSRGNAPGASLQIYRNLVRQRSRLTDVAKDNVHLPPEFVTTHHFHASIHFAITLLYFVHCTSARSLNSVSA